MPPGPGARGADRPVAVGEANEGSACGRWSSSRCSGLWFIARGGALTWFTGGEPRAAAAAARSLARLGRTPERAAALAAAGARAARQPQPMPPVPDRPASCAALEVEIRRVEEGDAPHQAARLRGRCSRPTTSCCIQLCQQVEVPTDDVGLPPLPSRERLTLEAELVAAGHDW